MIVERQKTSRDADRTTSKHVNHRIRTHKWHNRVKFQILRCLVYYDGILQAIFLTSVNSRVTFCMFRILRRQLFTQSSFDDKHPGSPDSTVLLVGRQERKLFWNCARGYVLNKISWRKCTRSRIIWLFGRISINTNTFLLNGIGAIQH